MKINKCPGGDCPIKSTCLRYTAPRESSLGIFIKVPFGKDSEDFIKVQKHGCVWFVGNSHIPKKRNNDSKLKETHLGGLDS